MMEEAGEVEGEEVEVSVVSEECVPGAAAPWEGVLASWGEGVAASALGEGVLTSLPEASADRERAPVAVRMADLEAVEVAVEEEEAVEERVAVGVGAEEGVVASEFTTVSSSTLVTTVVVATSVTVATTLVVFTTLRVTGTMEDRL